MTISNLVKVAGAVAVLGFIGQVQAHEGEDHSATPAVPMLTSAMSDPISDLNKNVAAGKISGGLGVNYVGKFIFDNTMAKVDMAKGKWGTELAVVNAPDGFPGFGGDKNPAEVVAIAPTQSMGWNDTASNPDKKGTTDLEADGFGWGNNARWYLVDLSKLASGNYYVSVKVERYDDGVKLTDEAPTTPAVLNADGSVKTAAVYPTMSDDDLVPALTVFDGYQNRGSHLNWFPNRNQKTTTPFWAEMLKTESTLQGTYSGKAGFDTAYGQTNNSIAQVSGTIKLDVAGKTAKTNRYLTIALGGDDRTPFLADGVTSAKHDVNYKLTVKVHKK